MTGLSPCRRGLFALTAVFVSCFAASVVVGDGRGERIVSVGGSVTEIIYALGQQDRLVGRDTTSVYPVQVNTLPDVGYMRRLSPEGLLSVNPDMIIAIEGAGPDETIDVLDAAQIRFETIPEGYTRAAVGEKIRAVGAALGEDEAADTLAEKVDAEIASAVDAAQATAGNQRVLFVLSAKGSKIMAGGTGTAADGIISMAGGVNAIDQFEGYKTLTDEAVTRAAPDVILMMKSRGAPTGSDRDLYAHPAISTTPAGRNKALVRIDGVHLLGFGPRTGSAVTELAAAIKAAGNS
ncbi:ABC transporter substrate-binding protein [Aquicoccus sp. SU-CL01552]|uniref:heme/hemin ABC transporter substrate-binding protein n=1 Tax=Aquicoccus sp. SU-CL01552 TaxID=3127656 RepID=UPI0031083224